MSDETPQRNDVVCPRCGEVKPAGVGGLRLPGMVETPRGARVLPTLGMARKAAGAGETCECGKRTLGGARD